MLLSVNIIFSFSVSGECNTVNVNITRLLLIQLLSLSTYIDVLKEYFSLNKYFKNDYTMLHNLTRVLLRNTHNRPGKNAID